MRKILLLLPLLLAACAPFNQHFPTLHTCAPTLTVSTDTGQPPFTVMLYKEQPQALAYVLRLVRDDYFNGNRITRAVPGYFVTFGERSWQNLPNAPAVTIPPRTDGFMAKRSAVTELALIQNANGTYGPHVLIRTGTAGQGAGYLPEALPVGRITENFATAAALTKADVLTHVTARVPTCPPIRN